MRYDRAQSRRMDVTDSGVLIAPISGRPDFWDELPRDLY
jgi:hypothetical protein